jgi:hypothetical protein
VTEQSERSQTGATRGTYFDTSGVLGNDITRAVDIIGALHNTSGCDAYMFLARAAKEARLSVGDCASVVVRTHALRP